MEEEKGGGAYEGKGKECKGRERGRGSRGKAVGGGRREGRFVLGRGERKEKGES